MRRKPKMKPGEWGKGAGERAGGGKRAHSPSRSSASIPRVSRGAPFVGCGRVVLLVTVFARVCAASSAVAERPVSSPPLRTCPVSAVEAYLSLRYFASFRGSLLVSN